MYTKVCTRTGMSKSHSASNGLLMTSDSIECCIRMPGAQTVRHDESLFEDIPVGIKEAFQNTRC